jgi:hypothetical protein
LIAVVKKILLLEIFSHAGEARGKPKLSSRASGQTFHGCASAELLAACVGLRTEC